MISVSVLFVFILLKILYSCLKSKKMKISQLFKETFFWYLFCSISINAGYAFKINNTTVAFNTVLSLFLLILSIFFIVQNKYNKKILGIGIVFWTSIVLGLVFNYLFPYKGGVVQNIVDWDLVINGAKSISYNAINSDKLLNYLLGVIRFPIILSVTFYIIKKQDVRKWVAQLYKTLPFFEAFGLTEFLFKIILHIDLSDVVSIFIGKTNSFPKIQGLTTEASQYAMVLFLYSIIVILETRFNENERVLNGSDKPLHNKKNNFRHLLIIYTLMILTTSLIAYYLLIISIIIVLINFDFDKKIFMLFLVMIIGIVFAVIGLPNYLVQRFGMINKVIGALRHGYEFHSYFTSEGARLSSIFYAVKAFIARPLFGVGIGVTDAHSMFFSILANFGLIGLLCYFKMWRCFSICKNNETKKIYWLILASTLLAGGLGYFVEFYLPFMVLAYFLSSSNN